jgi:hypothetical protein
LPCSIKGQIRYQGELATRLAVEGDGLPARLMERQEHAIHSPDITGEKQIRVTGEAAADCIETWPGREGHLEFL